ncbi:MAG: DUF2730 family protein [Desulfobulbaceae bacterium]
MVEQGTDYRVWEFWLRVGQIAGYVILGIYVWLSNRQKATVAEIQAVRKEVQDVQKIQAENCGKHLHRTTVLEGSVKSLPTHHDLGEMYEKINGVKSTVDEISGSMKGIGFQLKLLVEHHLKEGRK